MARDYKRRVQRKPKKKPTPVWVWLLTGFLLGVFSVGLTWLKLAPPEGAAGWIGAKPPAATARTRPAAKSTESNTSAVSAPRFDFYTLLPEMEVVVPDDELEHDVPARPAAVEKDKAYLLQVGSFRKAVDADRLKAQLALLGFEARVHRVKASAGRTWHRVRIGPYRSTSSLKTARQRLSSNGHDSLVIRVQP